MPKTVCWPICHHSRQSSILKSQILFSGQNKLWKNIINRKIKNQSNLLDFVGIDSSVIRNIIPNIKLGDKTNIEAQAAKKYWNKLFGNSFHRGRYVNDIINCYLNYGYAILRSTMARSICCSGLSPSIGVHHCNSYNTFCLVDDLMEPLRPHVDMWAFRANDEEKFDKETRCEFANLILKFGNENLFNVTNKIASDFKQVLQTDKKDIYYPDIIWDLNENE